MFAVTASRFSFLVIALLYLQNFAEGAEFNIPTGKIGTIVLPPNKTSTIETKGLSIKGSRFVVIQVHSQRKRVFLSSKEDFDVDFTKIGKNAGLVTLLENDQDEGIWYIKTNCTKRVTVSVIVQLYTEHDPIPGGCNQVFPLELDPSIHVEFDRPHRANVIFQWANLATPQGKALPDCEDDTVISNLEYEVYVMFMKQRDLGEDEFLNAVQAMIRPEDVVKHGTKIFSESNTPISKSQVSVTSREAQGRVYSVLAKRKDTGTISLYTTAAAYGCDLDNGECDVGQSVIRIVGAIVFGIVGLFLLFVGHRYFRATQVVFGFIFSSLLTYIGVYHAEAQDWICLLLAVLIGAIGGGLWLVVWQRFNFPTAQVFIMGLCAGYVVAAVIFFTPFGNITWWTAPINYGLCFTCITLLFSVSFMAFPKLLSIMSCCVVGSMMVLWSVSIPLWASLEMIFLNTLYHQTEQDYNNVKVAHPLNVQDIVIYAFWPALAFIGMGLQYFRERGHSGFSKPFETMRKHLLQDNEVPAPDSGSYDDEPEEERYNVSDSSSGERSRLLPGRPGQSSAYAPLYRSTHGRAQPAAPVNNNAKFNNVI